MPHIKTQEEWESEMSIKIFDYVKSELYLEFRYLNVALSALTPVRDKRIHTFATDGNALYFSTEQMLRVFQTNSRFLNRLYLHTVLHCIFSHLWVMPYQTENDNNRRIWHIACDIVVEYVIDHMDKPCTKRILGWVRQQFYEKLEQVTDGISAAVIYHMLWKEPDDILKRLETEFYTDDHCYWPKKTDNEVQRQIASSNQKKWDKIARQTKMEHEQRGNEKEDGEKHFLRQLEAAKSRRNYREFLQKFSVLREELHADPDEFDLNYYTYGLRIYGNLPLIEPMESREKKKIHELVIVIDTSYSTSGKLVKQFLKETLTILNQSGSFFIDSVIRILQCDNAVRKEHVICNEQEMLRFIETFELVGGGGTDFRPAFAYVNELLETKQCKNLGGLLYFTDGKGTYPKKKPTYKTAFLFLEEFEENLVPSWAMRIRLLPEEFETEREKR